MSWRSSTKFVEPFSDDGPMRAATRRPGNGANTAPSFFAVRWTPPCHSRLSPHGPTGKKPPSARASFALYSSSVCSLSASVCSGTRGRSSSFFGSLGNTGKQNEPRSLRQKSLRSNGPGSHFWLVRW